MCCYSILPVLPPGQVTNLVANSLTATSVSLTWSVEKTGAGDIFIERFVVLYSYTVNTCTATGSGMETITDGEVRAYTLSGLNEDSQYTITVTAINSEGNTSNTTTASTSTLSENNGHVCYIFCMHDLRSWCTPWEYNVNLNLH